MLQGVLASAGKLASHPHFSKMAKKFSRGEILQDFSKALKKSNQEAREEIKAARKKAARINLKLPSEIRRAFCHKCSTPFSGKGKVRLLKGKKVFFCNDCKKLTRIPFH